MGAVVLPVTRLCGTVVLGFPLGCRGGLEVRFLALPFHSWVGQGRFVSHIWEG